MYRVFSVGWPRVRPLLYFQRWPPGGRAKRSITDDGFLDLGWALMRRNLGIGVPARAEVRVQGPRGGDEEGSGRRVAKEALVPRMLV